MSPGWLLLILTAAAMGIVLALCLHGYRNPGAATFAWLNEQLTNELTAVRLDGAERIAQRILARAESVADEAARDRYRLGACVGLATVALHRGDEPGLEKHLAEVDGLAQRVAANDDPVLLRSLCSFCTDHLQYGEPEHVDALAGLILRRARLVESGAALTAAQLLDALGFRALACGRFDLAALLLDAAVDRCGNSPAGNAQRVFTSANLAHLAYAKDDFAGCLKQASALSPQAAELGDDYRLRAQARCLEVRGMALNQQGAWDEAEMALLEAERLLTCETDDDGSSTSDCHDRKSALVRIHLCENYLNAGRYAEALNAAEDALALANAAESPAATSTYGLALLTTGHAIEAAEPLEVGLQALSDLYGPHNVERGLVLAVLAIAYRDLDDFPRARRAITRALANLERGFGAQSLRYARALNTLAEVLLHEALANSRGRPVQLEDAETANARALEILSACPDSILDQPAFEETRAQLVLHAGRPAEALAILERVRATLEATVPSNHLWIAGTLQTMGEARLALQQLEQAQADLSRSLAIREKHLPPDHQTIRRTESLLARACRQQDHALPG